MRDAPVRLTDHAFPVLVFSHGFGGTRHQSVELTSHLASRGYVVVATNHSGRTMGELLPCLFVPPLDGCDIATDDPAPNDIGHLLDWLDAGAGFLDGAADVSNLGIFGHSAGGATTATMVQAEPRFLAAMPMAGTGTVTRDVPVFDMVADCDGVVTAASLIEENSASTNGSMVTVHGAGHLAFSDLCTVDLAGLADTYLSGADDLSGTFVDMLLSLGHRSR